VAVRPVPAAILGGGNSEDEALTNLHFSPDVLALNPGLAAEAQTETPSKYHNARAEARGMTFQSGHEAAVIGQLILLEERKQGVFALRLQVGFPLPGGIVYHPDAVYLDEKLEPHIVDAKAWDKGTGKFIRTKEYRLKKKLFKERYHREIEEV